MPSSGSARTDHEFEVHEPRPGLFLHLNSTSKRKTNHLAAYWVGALARADVTVRALLPAVLGRGTRSFPTLQEIHRRLEYLYGSSFSGDSSKIGERHVIGFRGEFVNDNYLPPGEGIVGSMVGFADEFMRCPRLVDGRFPTEVVEQEKVNHQRLIEGLLNDKQSYAYERCLAHMCATEPYHLSEYGCVEDLPGITADDLVDQMRRCVEQGEVHIYFSGDLEPDVAARALAPLVDGARGPSISLPTPTPDRAVTRPHRVSEQLDVQQTQLVLGFRTRTRFGDPLLPGLIIANGILGLFPHSKLFVNVREKASLCYSIGSHLERSQGLLFITSGVAPAQAEPALDLIQAQLRDLQAGEFEDGELAATLAGFDSRLAILEDTPSALIGTDLTWSLSGVAYDHTAYRRSLQAVTRELVVEAARRIELDTVYRLEPGVSPQP